MYVLLFYVCCVLVNVSFHTLSHFLTISRPLTVISLTSPSPKPMM